MQCRGLQAHDREQTYGSICVLVQANANKQWLRRTINATFTRAGINTMIVQVETYLPHDFSVRRSHEVDDRDV